jgi:hypothetical protein
MDGRPAIVLLRSAERGRGVYIAAFGLDQGSRHLCHHGVARVSCRLYARMHADQ